MIETKQRMEKVNYTVTTCDICKRTCIDSEWEENEDVWCEVHNTDDPCCDKVKFDLCPACFRIHVEQHLKGIIERNRLQHKAKTVIV